MEPSDLVRSLGTVPETRLGILELCRRCVNDQGEIAPELLLPLAEEVATATKETRQYVSATEKVRWSLERLMDR